ncbi:rna binding protein musashi [Echinococcus multilocularis]|uniref:Rna binding protein musashi n=1 Tax=Echinococcus multilocularis TaxID=6211 RepID=A0A087VXQ8_ECHMU|nr:rna binding protein musashi [Echinococcus multilocularis]
MTDSEGNEIGKLFVGGISQNTNNVSLRIYFSQFGELEDAVVMMDNKTGRSRGFGYVKYRDPECVKIVLAAKPHWLDGKEIDAKQCNVKMKGRNRRSLKVFVGGISLDQDAASIKAFFEKFGRVTDVNLMMDPNKQRHRGFAFIGFEEEIVVNRLISMHYLTMGNKQVEIKAMEPPNFGRKSGPPMTRHCGEISELKASTMRDTTHSHFSSKQHSRNRNYQQINSLQYGPSLDGNAYGPTNGQQQSYLNSFVGDTSGQMQQERLAGEQYSSGLFSLPGKLNAMPVIFTNSFVPITPTMYPGCQSYPYPILQPHFLHPGLLSGNEGFWSHGICTQQQILLPAAQSTSGPTKTNSASQTSPKISRSISGYCDGSDRDQRRKAFNEITDDTLLKDDVESSLNAFDQGLGMWCLNSARCLKACSSGTCLDQHSMGGLLIHNQEMSSSRQQMALEISGGESQQATILAKPSGDNFDHDETVSGIYEGGLTIMKKASCESSSEPSVSNANLLALSNSCASWLLPRSQQLTSTWNFRPPLWNDMQLPPTGFSLPPSFIFQPASTTTFDHVTMEHAMGGFGYAFPVLSERQSFRDEGTVINEPTSNTLLPANPTLIFSPFQPISTTGSLRQRRWESPEAPNLVEMHQLPGPRHHDTMGRWMPQTHINISSTSEVGKRTTTDEFGGKGGARGGGGGAGSESLCAAEKTSVAAGDHHANNFRSFRI